MRSTLQLIIIIAVMCYLPLDYGATSTYSQLVFISATCVLLSLSFLSELWSSIGIVQKISQHKSDLIVLLLLIIFYLMSIIPIPLFLIEWISPKIVNGYQEVQSVFQLQSRSSLSLSLDHINSRLELAVYLSAIALCGVIILYFSLGHVYILCWTALFMVLMQIGLHYYFQANDIQFIPIALVDGHHYRFNGTFVNSNHISAFLNTLMFMVFIAVMCWRSLAFRLRMILLLFVIVMIIFYQIKIGSRTGVISPFVALLLVLATAFFIRRELVKFIASGLIGLVVILALFVWMFPSREINFVEMLTFETLQERIIQWHATWYLIKDYLWFGVGLGNYESVFVIYKTEALSPFRFSHAHNTWLQLVAETGVIASIIFFSYLLFLFKRLIACLYFENMDNKDRLMIVLLASGGVNFGLQGLMDSLFVAKSVLVLFFVYIAITVIIVKHMIHKYHN